MKRILLIIAVIGLTLSAEAQNKKFQINGAARTYIFANELDIDNDLDSITTRKSNYGHALLDLGVSIYPNKNTEVIGMFRIRNELGGFWGGGTSFNVRQLTLKGVAGNVVRYELGDIDVSMTPYTVWNFQEEGIVNEADAFRIRRDVVHYDLFYMHNTWRMQGAKAEFGLNFNKGIKGIDFFSFITRQRAAELEPERLYGGGTIKIRQSDRLSLSLNSVSNFDLTETIADSLRYRNGVHTAGLNYWIKNNSESALGIHAEGGISSVLYENYTDPTTPEQFSDWFIDVKLKGALKAKRLSYELGFKDVGAQFLSPGAQTQRVNYGRFPAVYQQIKNDASGRPLSYTDVISGNAENSIRISEQLLPYNAAYNNTTPYGVATPNRRGVYGQLIRKDSTKLENAFLNVGVYQQSVGTGSLNSKMFMVTEAGADVALNDFIGYKRDLKLQLGVRYESTNRAGEEFEELALQSTLIDLGLSYEFADKLNLLLGAKLWSVSGNEFINERDRFNTLVDFDVVEFDFTENTLAGGLSYKFNENNVLTGQYQMFNIEHADEAIADYGINQFTLLFNMKF